MLPLAEIGFTVRPEIALITHCLKTYVHCLMAFLCCLTEVDGTAGALVLRVSRVPRRAQRDQELRSWGNRASLGAATAVACGRWGSWCSPHPSRPPRGAGAAPARCLPLGSSCQVTSIFMCSWMNMFYGEWMFVSLR